jgi:hypothetical protein
MVREFVAANRRWLQGIVVLLIAVLLGLFFVFRNQEEIILEKWHLGLILLPFFVIGSIHILLMYDAWLARGSEGVIGRLKKIAFLPIALVYALVLGFLLVRFVF